MKIGYFIPTYKRPAHKIHTHTFCPSAILVCDPKEANAYRIHHPTAEILECEHGVQGNLCRVRNWIIDYATEQGYDAVVLLDDDIRHIQRFDAPKPKKLDAERFLQTCEQMASMAQDAGVKLFGMNPVADKGAYREYTPFSLVSYIGGPFQGHILLNNPIRYDEDLPLKEDYDITLQHLQRFRRVLRFNMLHYIAEQSTTKGGCASYRNIKKEVQQFEALQQKWGSKIIQRDVQSKKAFDYNPILKPPIKGV